MNNAHGKFSTAARRWAGVGPYYAMFPSAFCDEVVEKYCKKGNSILDPFAGRATSLHSAATLGRHAVGVELNPIGWIYGQTKLAPADKNDVERRIAQLQSHAYRYSKSASELPLFFHRCFSANVRRYLLSARENLDWRKSRVDRTLMAFLLVHLHGKRTDSFSNQMRQTKAMAPKYALAWWKKRGLAPPKIDPVSFLQKKLDWRYAKGLPGATKSKIYFGDSTDLLPGLDKSLRKLGIPRPSLLLTSPPYFGITNYHYDQWIRLWLLGGPPTDSRTLSQFNGKHQGKFANLDVYRKLLATVFGQAAHVLKPDCVVYVRTDRREPTLTITKLALTEAFPNHRLQMIRRPIRGKTQTRLFGNDDPRLGEVDILMSR
jgi:hypothetical protein